MNQCRSCKAPIVWVSTALGKRLPLDPDPVEGGNLVVIQGSLKEPASEPIVTYRRPDHGGRLTYQTHFASCPHATQFRRPRPRTIR
jgi:hypothetical protein